MAVSRPSAEIDFGDITIEHIVILLIVTRSGQIRFWFQGGPGKGGERLKVWIVGDQEIMNKPCGTHSSVKSITPKILFRIIILIYRGNAADTSQSENW